MRGNFPALAFWRESGGAATGDYAMSETGSETVSGKPSILSHTGLMTVIAAAISALAAVGVAYIQKSGPAEKPADASASAAAVIASGAAPAPPVYVTKLVNGRMIKVLVPAPQAGKAAAGAVAGADATTGGAQSAAASAEGNANPAPTHDSGNTAASESHPHAAEHAAAEPAAEAPADSGDEGQ